MRIKLKKDLFHRGEAIQASDELVNHVMGEVNDISQQNVLSFNVVKAVSTLQQNPDLALDVKKKEDKQGFMYFFTNMHTGNPVRALRSYEVMASLVARAYYPEVDLQGLTKMTRKLHRKVSVDAMSDIWKEMELSKSVCLRRIPTGFQVMVPVFAVSGGSRGMHNALLYLGAPERDQSGPVFYKPMAEVNPAPRAIGSIPAGPNLHQRSLGEWASCNAQLVPKRFGDDFIFFIQYDIEKRIASYLVNEKFELIRDMDVYGPIEEWVSSYYGDWGRSALYSMPIRQIARAVKTVSQQYPVQPRTSPDGLLIDEHADIFWVPSEIDEIQRFEDVYADAYTHESGVYGMVDMFAENISAQSRKKPPVPMPVFADWVNLKLSYTNAEGKMDIMNLDRTYKVQEHHLFRWADVKLHSRQAEIFLKQSFAMGGFFGVAGDQTHKGFLVAVERYARMHESLEPQDIKLSDIWSYATEVYDAPLKEAQAFLSMCKSLLEKMEASPETAYARYSVKAVMMLRAGLLIMTKYASKGDYLKDTNKAYETKYESQVYDKNYKFPAVPFINDSIGTLPHQTKTLNITRGMMDNILFPVEAGGGKTMIYVLSILREMQNGQQGPFILQCPSHLVAQYVKEFVYATGGRMNIVPVTTYTIRRQGLDRLGAMIKNAPVNTIILTDYNVITLKKRTISYGTTNVTVYPVIEFLRQFSPQVWYSDETHLLKSQSQKQSAVNRLIADIPKKRGASGTFVSDTIKDLVRQVALFDPSVFGTLEDFIAEHALEMKGSKVLEWKPGTERLVKSILRRNAVVAEAKRKEWAAILPTPIERFHPVDMTENQQKVYDQILTEVTDELRAKMSENKALKNALGESSETPDPDADPNEATDAVDDDEEEFDLDKMLNNSLARLEMFVLSPSTDKLGKEVLKGDDMLSPKVIEIVRIVKEHLDQNIPGKVLIFTNFIQSAIDIFEAFPPEIKSKVIYYTAGNKEECGARFEKDDSMRVMVGVEYSMNTGLNLQNASRLIRCQTVWTPGALEQGNARIGRPNIKTPETRSEIYYDWVVSNKTIDVTKVSYLMAKSIARGKFEEAGNPRFDGLIVPKLFPMSLSTLIAKNDFTTTLEPYFESYAAYKKAMFEEWEDFKKNNRDWLFDENGKVRMNRIDRSANLPESKLIVRVPYVPGTELYKAEDLGLIRYDEYFRRALEANNTVLEQSPDDGLDDDENENDDGPDDADNSSVDNKAVPEKLRLERELMLNLSVHTDRGDGEIIGINKGPRLVVMLPTGEKIYPNRLSAFVITRAETTNSDIRNQILKMAGDVPIDAPVESLESQMTDRKKRQLEKEQRQSERQKLRDDREARRAERKTTREDLSFDEEDEAQDVQEESPDENESGFKGFVLEPTIVNDVLGIRVINLDEEEVPDRARTFGFKFSPGYYAAIIKTPDHFKSLIAGWQNAGYEVAKDNYQMCFDTYMKFAKSKKKVTFGFGFATDLNLKNFYREEFKPEPRGDLLKPYPIVQDGYLYLALPERGHAASLKAIREVKVPGVRWDLYSQGEELIAFTLSKSGTTTLMRRILDAGVVVKNLDELRKEIVKMKFLPD